MLIKTFVNLQSNRNTSITSQNETVTIYTTVQDIQVSGMDEVDRRLAETCDNEEIMTIITEFDVTQRQLNAERQRVSELEDQLSSLSKSFFSDETTKIARYYFCSNTKIIYIFLCLHLILVQDNRDLQNRVAQNVMSDVGEMRSMHDELAILEESG